MRTADGLGLGSTAGSAAGHFGYAVACLRLKEEGGRLTPGVNTPARPGPQQTRVGLLGVSVRPLLVGGCGWLVGLLLEPLAHAIEHVLA